MSDVLNYLENKILDHVFAPTAYTAPATVYLQLHIGPPGEDGTSNVAATSVRKAASFGTASNGTISNDAAITWTTGQTATETITHWTLWDALTTGNGLWKGTVNGGTGEALTAGNEFTVPIGDLDVSLD